MGVPIFHVDAFASRLGTGNPAAVCLLPDFADDAWLQAIAAEMNLSETAFVLSRAGRNPLRWFTPTTEVDLCGHATLATAHVLWWTQRVPPLQPIVFETRAGSLTARKRDALIELDFPATPPREAEPPNGLLAALGVEPLWVASSRYDYLVVCQSEEVVRSLEPDFAVLRTVVARGVIVTSASSDARYDFVSRFFAPAAGVNEDPVTGSAHCVLAPYWSKELGKASLTGYQASKRGGVVSTRVDEDRVILGGRAIIVAQGELVDHADISQGNTPHDSNR